MKLVDAHCHFLPDVYVKALKKYDRINEDGFPIPDGLMICRWNIWEKPDLPCGPFPFHAPSLFWR